MAFTKWFVQYQSEIVCFVTSWCLFRGRVWNIWVIWNINSNVFDINSFLAEKFDHLRGSFEIPPPIRLPDDNQTVQDVPGKSILLKFTVWGNWNHFELFGSKTWNFRQLLFFWDTLYIKIYTITPDFKAWHYWIWPLHCFITPCVTALMCFAIVILQLPSQFPTVHGSIVSFVPQLHPLFLSEKSVPTSSSF